MHGLSIILPIHNESVMLGESVRKAKDFMDRQGIGYEIIIAEDGSSDGSRKIAASLESGRVRVISSAKRLGRGATLCNAIRDSVFPVVMYMDIDLSASLQSIPDLLSEMENGADIAVGSRHIAGSIVNRGLIRDIVSRAYNLLARSLCRSRVHDHQCGFKAFRKEAVLPLLNEVKASHWFWDTELLVRAQRKGMEVREVAVRWNGTRHTKVNLISDILDMGWSLARLSLSR